MAHALQDPAAKCKQGHMLWKIPFTKYNSISSYKTKEKWKSSPKLSEVLHACEKWQLFQKSQWIDLAWTFRIFIPYNVNVVQLSIWEAGSRVSVPWVKSFGFYK